MSVENLGQQNENDPTKLQREELAAGLQDLTDEDSKKMLEKFKSGIFFIPSETTKKMNELISSVQDIEKRKILSRLYNDILEQG